MLLCWLSFVLGICVVLLVCDCDLLAFPLEERECEFDDDGEVAECSDGDCIVDAAVDVAVLRDLFDSA